jgi:hypothetical protein
MKHSQTYLQQSSSLSHQGCGWTTAMKQKDPMPRPEDYAGYVRSNLKWLVKEYNKRNGKEELNIK